jgi:hypothetical protein
MLHPCGGAGLMLVGLGAGGVVDIAAAETLERVDRRDAAAPHNTRTLVPALE